LEYESEVEEMVVVAAAAIPVGSRLTRMCSISHYVAFTTHHVPVAAHYITHRVYHVTAHTHHLALPVYVVSQYTTCPVCHTTSSRTPRGRPLTPPRRRCHTLRGQVVNSAPAQYSSWPGSGPA
jgi:hypothetical protein